MSSRRPHRRATSIAWAVPLSGGSAEEQQVLAGARMGRESVDIYAMVNGGGVVQIRVSIGVAYRHVSGGAVVTLVDRNDLVRREAMDGGDHRCRDEIAIRERQEVEPVVDDVELAGALEHRGDVQALCDLGVDRRNIRPAKRRGCVQPGRGDRVCGGEQRDVMAGRHQPLGEQRGELLPRPVVARWCPPRDRRQHGDSDRDAGRAGDGNVDALRLLGPNFAQRVGTNFSRGRKDRRAPSTRTCVEPRTTVRHSAWRPASRIGCRQNWRVLAGRRGAAAPDWHAM